MLTHEERIALAVKFNKMLAVTKVAGQIATRDMILEGSLSDEEIETLVDIYPKWEPDVNLEMDDLVSYQGTLYKVLQAHKTQANWTPDIATSLYVGRTPEAVIPEWVQPTGAHDAYNTGDKVYFEGSVYESLINGNTWSPTGYPAGWKKVE